ncbi:hypothetical protein T484DRAFT_2509380 [Baffinella frigidus]|nr:hypothetical protein T484DRAFT_2509380 [Cryptophyta sp. CCMP2293]
MGMMGAEKEPTSALWWSEPLANGVKVNGAQIGKTRDSHDFVVGLGSKEFTTGQHEFDFSVSRTGEGYIHVGVAVPHLETNKTFCRRDASDQVWYYFGTGYTCALRNGWDDVLSKEVGGIKLPKVVHGDKLRAFLDMDSGELRFSLYKGEDAAWKEIPGTLTGIKGPVVAACCIQDRGDSIIISDGAKNVPVPKSEAEVGGKKKNKYSHVVSKLVSNGIIRQKSGGSTISEKENQGEEGGERRPGGQEGSEEGPDPSGQRVPRGPKTVRPVPQQNGLRQRAAERTSAVAKLHLESSNAGAGGPMSNGLVVSGLAAAAAPPSPRHTMHKMIVEPSHRRREVSVVRIRSVDIGNIGQGGDSQVERERGGEREGERESARERERDR